MSRNHGQKEKSVWSSIFSVELKYVYSEKLLGVTGRNIQGFYWMQNLLVAVAFLVLTHCFRPPTNSSDLTVPQLAVLFGLSCARMEALEGKEQHLGGGGLSNSGSGQGSSPPEGGQ